jgi:hypothetical protein
LTVTGRPGLSIAIAKLKMVGTLVEGSIAKRTLVSEMSINRQRRFAKAPLNLIHAADGMAVR